MAHFAKMENNIVTEVIVASQETIDSGLFGDPASWLQTSYNTRGGIYYIPNSYPPIPDPDQSKAFRKNYAGKGFIYNAEIDGFVPEQPYSSWTLNSNTGLWDSPVPYPDDGQLYIWDEAALAWVLPPTE